MPSEDAWTFYEELGDGDRSKLTRAQQAVLAICDLRQEVNSGGFDSYFRYWGGDTAQIALAALPDVLGPRWASVLLDAMETLGPGYPIDPDIRARRIDERDLDDTLNALDARLFELEGSTDADSLLNAYLASQS